MRRLVLVLVGLLAVAGIVYLLAGRASGPTIQINQPQRYIGAAASFDVTIETPGGRLTDVHVTLEQEGRPAPVFAMGGGPSGANVAMKQESPDRIRVTGALGKATLPDLRPGAARLTVSASRPVLYGLRTAASTASRDLQVRLDPPRVSVLSMHHHVRHGGAEMVVYRVTPTDVRSGVRVGDKEYPGHPASGAGVSAGDDMKVVFFALLHDQDLAAPIQVFARDEAGNEAKAPVDVRVFPRPFRRSRIELDDRFLGRVVPEILDHVPELKAQAGSSGDLVPPFLAINRDLRRRNNEHIASFAAKTAPRMLWQGAFRQLTNSQVESSFADHRTYFYKGTEIDQQVHLGFDLAVTAAIPIVAANRGTVLFADYLGIYGNCVIIDHGMGVQSLYGHLSSIEVKPGADVEQNQPIGRSGMTGLAGGDHLHFTMLVNGQPVSPVEWWDAHWIEDRVTRKLREAAPTTPTP